MTYSAPINVRGGPSTISYPIIGQLAPGEVVPTLGISPAREWILITYPQLEARAGSLPRLCRYLTGSREVLEPVWKDYGVSAALSHEGNAITHTPGTYLIHPLGQKRWYISTPFLMKNLVWP